MRLAWFAGVSTALAGGVVLSAFHQRANFYSAMVYLFQSNLCIMILVNLLALIYSSFVYTLQRVCFGQLRAIEVEQLYEKAWFAVTETCLAMTIFRDEIGGFFIAMFVALLTGKVWGWIGEGRIEALEQQPPANPRLFHTRLIISLALSLAYDTWLLYYAVTTVIDQAKPDMMVMFLFEFAVLLITSLHTALRYSIILLDTSIVKRQMQERLQERRRQIREEREAILRRREEAQATAEAAAATGQEGAEEALAALEQADSEPLPDEDDVDEMDIEVAGWEAKGQYVLGLDLFTDFTKLVIYAVFFCVLLSFYGLPLHIIRDLFMTIRSFIKRLGALMKYRQATRDMNRYDDATEQDLERENTCIICREDMHVWVPNDGSRIERTRPKKLPCGHILHLGCLKSWMERQQVCPTCRRSVVIDDASNANRNRDAALFRIGLNIGRGAAGADAAGAAGVAGAGAAPAGGPAAGVDGAINLPLNPHGQAFPAPDGQAAAPGVPPAMPGQAFAANNNQQLPQAPAANGPGLRMFNFGPIRLGFAQGGARDIQEMAQRLGLPNAMAGPEAAANGGAPTANGYPGVHAPFAYQAQLAGPGASSSMSTSTSTESILQDLQAIERRIEQGAIELQLASAEARLLRSMILELQRIRAAPYAAGTDSPEAAAVAVPTPTQPLPGASQTEQQPEQAPGETTPTQTSAQRTEIAGAQRVEQAQQAQHAHGQQPLFGPAVFGQQHNTNETGQPVIVRMIPDTTAPAIPAGSSELPPYVQIPAGWSLLPLRRCESAAAADTGAWQAEAGPSNSGVAEQSLQPTVETVAETTDETASPTAVETANDTASHNGAASSSSLPAPPAWGGSAQLFGSSSQAEASSATASHERSAGDSL